MASFEKDDLYYKDYTWVHSKGDNPNITGKIDQSKVSGKEGYEVLDFIQAFMKEYKLTTKAEGQKVEKMLKACKDKFPTTHERTKIKEIIVQNWSKF